MTITSSSATVVYAAPYAPHGPGLSGTSTSSVQIGLGPKVFITQLYLGFTPGMRVRASPVGTTNTWLEGVVTSYEINTLQLTCDLHSDVLGTYADWTINLTGQPGVEGDPGLQGPQGIPGGGAPLASPVFTGDPRAPTQSLGDNDTSIATTEFVKGQGYLTSSLLASYGYAPLASPVFTGDPQAPTPATADDDTSLATTAFVKAQGYITTATVTSGYQPYDADLTSLAAAAATNAIYYRSSVGVWSPVAIGDNMSFAGGTLSSTGGGGGGGGDVYKIGTPISGQIAQWTGTTTIQGIDAVSLGFAPIVSPEFTGTPTSITPATDDNDTSIATTAFVKAQGYAPLASPALTGTPTAPTATVGDNDTSIATTAFVQTAIAESVIGVSGGLLAYVSASQIKFAPYNNDIIRVDGTWYAIPPAGITAANIGVYINGTGGQNLAASTLYYVYLFNNAGTLTVDFSTTSHAMSTTAGNVGTEVKSGDDTRSLIGMIRTTATSQFADSLTQRFVRSWFNARSMIVSNSFTAQRTASSLTVLELSTEIRSEFLTWASDTVSASTNGVNFNSSTFYTYTAIGWDGALTSTTALSATYGSNGGPTAAIESKKLTEGYHYITMLGMVNGGLGSWGGATWNSLHAVIM